MNRKMLENSTKWYRNFKFPLIPIVIFRKASEYDTGSFSVHWLFFQCWTLDSFEFELAIVASTHWGLGIIGILPYLRLVFTIPCPDGLTVFLYKYFWRKTKSERSTKNKL